MNPMTSLGTMTYYVVLVTWCVALVCQGAQDFLFYSSLGDSTHSAGIYGGPISVQDGGKGGDMTMYGYDCVAFDDDVTENGEIDWFDVDENSNKLLYRPREDGDQLTLVVAPICHKAPYCRNTTQEVKFHRFQLNQHKEIGPIAYYHETIYFIYYDIEKPDDMKTSKIQLRKFNLRTSCTDLYPVTPTSTFTIEECSEVIATLQEEKYEHMQGYRSLDYLHVYGGSGSPSFLVQIQETRYEGRRRQQVNAVLTHVTRSGVVTSLYTQPITDLSYFAMELRQLGGISLMGSKVCWAPIDRVLCGDLTGTSLSNVETTLQTMDVEQACQVDVEPTLKNIVTGVAIAESDPDLAFYFGCLAQIKNAGGAGLVRVPRSGTTGSVTPLVSVNGSYISAGSLQLTQHCHYNPSQGAEVILAAASGAGLNTPFTTTSALLLTLTAWWTFRA